MTNAKRVRRWMSFHCAEIGRVTEPAFTESLVEVLDAAEQRGFNRCMKMALARLHEMGSAFEPEIRNLKMGGQMMDLIEEAAKELEYSDIPAETVATKIERHYAPI